MLVAGKAHPANEDGTIMVDYSGHCQECGVGLDFKHEHKFFPKDE